MATKNDKVTEQAFKALNDYFTLSKLLFVHPSDEDENAPAKKLNEILTDKKSDFYKTAVQIADECEMSWKKLTPEDSDELELMLLEEYYNRIKVDDSHKFFLNIVVREKGGE